MKLTLSKESIIKYLGLLLIGIAVVSLFGVVLTFLWNWLMPELFGVQKISLVQGFGVFLLSKIIFGGFSGESKKEGSEAKEINIEKSSIANKEYEDLYEKWWSEQGESLYEKYVNEAIKNEK